MASNRRHKYLIHAQQQIRVVGFLVVVMFVYFCFFQKFMAKMEDVTKK